MKKLHYIALCLVAAAIVGLILMAPSAPHGPTGAAVSYVNATAMPEKITLGMSSVQPLNGLLTVAYDKGFFADEGLDINVVEFNSGKEALQAFLGGSLDVSVSGEVPVMFSALKGFGVHHLLPYSFTSSSVV